MRNLSREEQQREFHTINNKRETTHRNDSECLETRKEMTT